MAQAHCLGERGVMPNRRSLPIERLMGMGAPHSAGPQARGMVSRAQRVVVNYGAPAGDDSPQWRGPTARGDGES